MPVCAFEAAITGPAPKINGVSGGLVLAKSGTQNNSTACDFVLLTSAEYDQIFHALSAGTSPTPNYPAWNELGSLSIADAQVITGYVALLWAGVWGIKQIIKSLSISERNQDE